jgi:DNA-binding CsgD family transcriptional regulator
MLHNKPWTKDEERRLVELRASGKSCVSIAAALKRTARAVNSRLSILRKRNAEQNPNGPIGAAQGAAS